jgi:two-component system chemotaxis response regulator CheY
MRISIIQNNQAKYLSYFKEFELNISIFGVDEINKIKTARLVIICGLELESGTIIKTLRNSNIKAMIVHLYENFDYISKVLSNGADDYFCVNAIDKILLSIRIKTWVAAAKYKELVHQDKSDGKNAFEATVWDRRVRFNIRSEHSLELFWEYFLNDKRFETCENAKKIAKIVYSICDKILYNSKKQIVFLEENENYYFLTIIDLKQSLHKYFENIEQTYNIEDNKFIGIAHKRSKGIFSIFSKKIVANKTIAIKNDTQIIPNKILNKFDAILNKSIAKNIDCASDYVRESKITNDDLKEMEILENEVNENLFYATNTTDQLKIFGAFFDAFANTINELMEFEDLKIAIQEASLISNLVTQHNNIAQEKALVYASLIKQDLYIWKTHIFILQDAQNIHYLDASLLASCMQFKKIIEPNQPDNDDDIEFF